MNRLRYPALTAEQVEAVMNDPKVTWKTSPKPKPRPR